jgi:translation elongation factor EF-1beta
MDSTKKRKGKFLVVTATLVPEAEDVENEKLEEDIRQEIEEVTIPWVKEILKVTISDYLFEDD